jgi:hypothetical protein
MPAGKYSNLSGIPAGVNQRNSMPIATAIPIAPAVPVIMIHFLLIWNAA